MTADIYENTNRRPGYAENPRHRNQSLHEHTICAKHK